MSDDVSLVDLSIYPTLLTVRNVAEVLQLSTHAVRARIRARDLASVKMGHSVRVPRAALERYLIERTVPSRARQGGEV